MKKHSTISPINGYEFNFQVIGKGRRTRVKIDWKPKHGGSEKLTGDGGDRLVDVIANFERHGLFGEVLQALQADHEAALGGNPEDPDDPDE